MIGNGTIETNGKRAVGGCIDLGSSYARLLVLRMSDPPAVLLDEKRFIGWGSDLVRTGRLSPPMIDLAGRVLRELVAAASAAGCAAPAIVATNAVRSAANGPEVADRLRALVRPLRVRVADAGREAALGFRGASSVPGAPSPALMVDAGGTSTEIAWGEGGEPEGWRSFPWGVHRVRERMGGGPLRTRRLRGLLAAGFSRSLPAGLLSSLSCGDRGATMLATGGTAVSLARLARWVLGEPWDDPVWIDRERFELLSRRLRARYALGRGRNLPLDPARIELLPAGIVLLGALADAVGAAGFLVTVRDLRWGAILCNADTREPDAAGTSS